MQTDHKDYQGSISKIGKGVDKMFQNSATKLIRPDAFEVFQTQVIINISVIESKKSTCLVIICYFTDRNIIDKLEMYFIV